VPKGEAKPVPKGEAKPTPKDEEKPAPKEVAKPIEEPNVDEDIDDLPQPVVAKRVVCKRT